MIYGTKPTKILLIDRPPFFVTTVITMSTAASFLLFATKLPPPCSPIVKTLTPLTSFPILPARTNLWFLKSITIQSIPTKPSPPKTSSNPATSALQPVEELPGKLQEIVKLFQSVQDTKAKYEQLLFYGKNLKPLDSQFKTNENKVQGCVSQVWLRAYLDSSNKENVIFEADSDSAFTKGLAALLVQGLSGHSVQEILRVSPDFVVLLGLQQTLTPSRNNGFLNMLKLMQKKALMLYVEAEKGIEPGTDIGKTVENVESGSTIDDGNRNSAVDLISDSAVDDLKSREAVLGSRGQRIMDILRRELQPVELDVEDVSYQHAGHAGARGNNGETHFNLKVVSKEFEGKSLVKRHRLIYSLLDNELQSGLHALSIEAKTPAEVGNQ